MENIEILILCIPCAFFLFLIIAALVKYFSEYSAESRYLKMEIKRSDEWDEYVHWKRELSNLRWSILPGLTPDRVERIRRFFYKGRHKNKKENDGLFAMLLPCVLGIVVCCACLTTGTYSWFTASVSTQIGKIQATSNFNSSSSVNSSPVTSDDVVSITGNKNIVNTESKSAYIIKDGDTLSKIASTYGCTVEAIANYNNIADAKKIQVGQTLKIPPVSVSSKATQSDVEKTASATKQQKETNSQTESTATHGSSNSTSSEPDQSKSESHSPTGTESENLTDNTTAQPIS